MPDPEVFIDGVRYVRADRVPVVGRAGVLAQIHRMFWGEAESEASMLEHLDGCFVQIHDEAPSRPRVSCSPVEEFLGLCEREAPHGR